RRESALDGVTAQRIRGGARSDQENISHRDDRCRAGRRWERAHPASGQDLLAMNPADVLQITWKEKSRSHDEEVDEEENDIMLTALFYGDPRARANQVCSWPITRVPCATVAQAEISTISVEVNVGHL